MALGGSLENALVCDERRWLNAEGLRFPDEPARHKTLDLLGDLFALVHNLKKFDRIPAKLLCLLNYLHLRVGTSLTKASICLMIILFLVELFILDLLFVTNQSPC